MSSNYLLEYSNKEILKWRNYGRAFLISMFKVLGNDFKMDILERSRKIEIRAETRDLINGDLPKIISMGYRIRKNNSRDLLKEISNPYSLKGLKEMISMLLGEVSSEIEDLEIYIELDNMFFIRDEFLLSNMCFEFEVMDNEIRVWSKEENLGGFNDIQKKLLNLPTTVLKEVPIKKSDLEILFKTIEKLRCSLEYKPSCVFIEESERGSEVVSVRSNMSELLDIDGLSEESLGYLDDFRIVLGKLPYELSFFCFQRNMAIREYKLFITNSLVDMFLLPKLD